jgi:hypothetical protein
MHLLKINDLNIKGTFLESLSSISPLNSILLKELLNSVY